MKNILIIYPHWPPSNLAGVHRPRLLANFLPDFGWQPIVLTVKPEYYEEVPDYDMCKLVSDKVIVRYVNAFRPPKRIRIIGDIGLRAFFQLWKEAKKIIRENRIDFIFIPIPSNYTALLGRFLYEEFKVPYGIDYIDPWYGALKGKIPPYSRRGMTKIAARILEPFAVKKASLISGVSSSYYDYVFRQFIKNKKIENVGMPYGFDPRDHEVTIPNLNLPWKNITNCKPIIYAGAFLPKSRYFIEGLFKAIRELKSENSFDKTIRLFFLGTGQYKGKSISDYASDFDIGELVIEERGRIPFLNVINFLKKSYGVMVIGSTEKHYTASKTFQAILSNNPVFAILHNESSAVNILDDLKANKYLIKYDDNEDGTVFQKKIKEGFQEFIQLKQSWNPDFKNLDKYSAKRSTSVLVDKLLLIS